MKLTDCHIELQRWGENKDRYEAKIEYEGERGGVKLVLTPEVSEKLLAFLGPVITEFSHKAALEIEANIQQSLTAAGKQPLIEA